MHYRKVAIGLVSACVLVFSCAGAGQTTYVYVANYSANSISGYSVNRTTGFLTPVSGSPFPAGTNPIYISLDRQCRYMYAPNIISNDLSSYVIDQNTGNATQLPDSPYPVGTNPNYSAIDQLGKFLYVPIQGPNVTGNTVMGFAINADTGTLTPTPGSPFATGGVGTNQTIVDPSNRFVFVLNGITNDVSGFTVDPSSGALTQIPGSPWPTGGSSPRVLRTDNTGRFLYVSNRSSLSIFRIDPTTGVLTQVNGSPMPLGSDLYAIAFDASNKFVYVGNNFQGIYGFSIDSNTGLLTPLPGFPMQIDSPQGNPVALADPSFEILYTASFNGSNTVSVWAIDPNSGALSLIPGSSVSTGRDPGTIQICTADADGALARLVGGNTFIGNQAVNGSVAATSFIGDGSNLLSLNPANLAAGTAGISITGTAANASELGGVVASNYARLDIGNSFVQSQQVSGNLSVTGTVAGNSGSFAGLTSTQVTAGTLGAGILNIGGGTPIAEYVSTTDSLTIPALTPGSCITFTTAALTGFTPGLSDTMSFGIPSALVSGLGSGVSLLYQAWETTTTASPTITIQVCNPTSVKYKGGATGTIRVDVFKH